MSACLCTPCREARIWDGAPTCLESIRRSPRQWQEQIGELVADWLRRRPGLPEYDAADLVMELDLSWCYGEHLHQLARELAWQQRELAACECQSAANCDECDGSGYDRTPVARVVWYGTDGERQGPRCPVCHGSEVDGDECPVCGVTLRTALEVVLAESIAAEE